MNKAWVKRCSAFLQKVLRNFAVYGAIPLVCGGMIGLLIFVQSAGTSQVEELFAMARDQSIVSVIGGGPLQREAVSGFYFPNKDLLPPLHDQVSVVLGNATYFSPEAEEDAATLPAETPDIIYDSLPSGATPIISCDLSSSSFCINTTNLTIDMEAVRNADFPVEAKQSEEPLVLVLHTHGTEGYFEDNTNLSDFATDGVSGYFLPESTSFRTTDPQKSVVRVGEVFTQTLISRGIPALHVTVMHDLEDFNSAYSKSGETVKKMLAQYPSIQYVVDLHRDSVVRGDSYVKSFTTVEDTPSAQVMLVVGTGKHDNWEKNLVVAASFKEQMDQSFPSLSRALYLRKARYNQQYLPGCLLLEVGSAANTLQEAENAARFAAIAFSDMIKNEQ